MGNRKDKPTGMRLLSAVAAFMLIGSAAYLFVAGVNFYAGVVLATAILGLGIPSVSAGEGALEMIIGFFESFIDGVMEVIGGLIDALTSIFS